ncbi:GH3 auxin-responsive promoter family protein [Streptomyces sp. NBC_01136]|uniref:GH3 family domain-containing protein n=1 Tax=unclassified Streptomyces TaxID=2593676 RepID=UPI003255E60E|nr:GH3 auxin-responsive promoter family protein [Streptomyces sp. NBC_01136]WST81170.1 GH3 auxin-responsive promoter family protein [Streptomyces sp. NBC_01136]
MNSADSRPEGTGPDDSGSEGSEGSDPNRVRRYRERVFGERDGLRAALGDAAGHQRRVLAELLEHNADTAYGRAHGFGSIRSLDDFRKAVPINDYAALAPWIERMAAGESNLLSADDPAVYFTSSGTTGAHKKIPVTASFMRRTFFPFYYAAWAPLIEHHPDVLARPDAVLNLKHDPIAAPPTTASGHPHVGASQVDFGARFGEPLSAEPGTAAPWGTLPVPVAQDDHLEKTYLRLRLAAESDVRCVIGINPAMVAAVPYQLNLWWPRLVKEIRDGTLGGVPHTSPNPARAAELERLADHFGTLRPAHVWPHMRALFCWTTGMATLYLPRLREEFGVGVAALPAPAAASEGPTAVALDRHGSAGSLVVTAAVYEFLDAETDVRPDAPTLSLQELEPGRDYHVVFSHIGGLYRYAVGDVVRVVDRVGGVPRVEYAGRGTRCDAAGERLRDAQVVRALAAAARSTGLDVRNAACRVNPPPDAAAQGGAAHYEFAVAAHDEWNALESDHFAELLDAAIGRESPGYRAARRAGRLGPLTLRRLDGEAFLRAWHTTVASGVRPPQVKDRLFRQDTALWEQLTGAPATGRGGQA